MRGARQRVQPHDKRAPMTPAQHPGRDPAPPASPQNTPFPPPQRLRRCYAQPARAQAAQAEYERIRTSWRLQDSRPCRRRPPSPAPRPRSGSLGQRLPGTLDRPLSLTDNILTPSNWWLMRVLICSLVTVFVLATSGIALGHQLGAFDDEPISMGMAGQSADSSNVPCQTADEAQANCSDGAVCHGFAAIPPLSRLALGVDGRSRPQRHPGAGLVSRTPALELKPPQT